MIFAAALVLLALHVEPVQAGIFFFFDLMCKQVLFLDVEPVQAG